MYEWDHQEKLALGIICRRGTSSFVAARHVKSLPEMWNHCRQRSSCSKSLHLSLQLPPSVYKRQEQLAREQSLARQEWGLPRRPCHQSPGLGNGHIHWDQRNVLTSPPERKSPAARVPPVPKLLAPKRAFCVNVNTMWSAQDYCFAWSALGWPISLDSLNWLDFTKLKEHSESYIGLQSVPMSQDIFLCMTCSTLIDSSRFGPNSNNRM